jgi:hypothetical protein
MIVYFFKKSKKYYKKWGIGACVGVLIGYMGVINIQEYVYDKQTVQIIRNQELIDRGVLPLDVGSDSVKHTNDFLFVASKRGKYYYPINCKKAQGLSVKNMLYFKDNSSAEDAGYKLISGC